MPTPLFAWACTPDIGEHAQAKAAWACHPASERAHAKQVPAGTAAMIDRRRTGDG
jgi:hypothetical protein